MIPTDPEVSKCNQSKWPSDCNNFHGHQVMRNSLRNWIFLLRVTQLFLESSCRLSAPAAQSNLNIFPVEMLETMRRVQIRHSSNDLGLRSSHLVDLALGGRAKSLPFNIKQIRIHTFTSNILFEQRGRFGLGCPSHHQVKWQEESENQPICGYFSCLLTRLVVSDSLRTVSVNPVSVMALSGKSYSSGKSTCYIGTHILVGFRSLLAI